MKLLLLSDLHMDTRAAQGLVQMAGEVDVVIGAGDFGNMRKGVSACIDILKAIDRPSVLVPGNNESFDELQAACAVWPSTVVLHGHGVEIDGIPFFGIGGGIPVTPFGSWSFDLSEQEAAALLKNSPDNAILISHSPPKGAVDISSAGQSLGSDRSARRRPFEMPAACHLWAHPRQRRETIHDWSHPDYQRGTGRDRLRSAGLISIGDCAR